MRPPKKASKVVRADRERSAASKAILEPAARVLSGDEHATPWDEPSRDWGRRGYGQLRVITKAYRRDRFYGTR
jgi:hypothetical protein